MWIFVVLICVYASGESRRVNFTASRFLLSILTIHYILQSKNCMRYFARIQRCFCLFWTRMCIFKKYIYICFSDTFDIHIDIILQCIYVCNSRNGEKSFLYIQWMLPCDRTYLEQKEKKNGLLIHLWQYRRSKVLKLCYIYLSFMPKENHIDIRILYNTFILTSIACFHLKEHSIPRNP